MVADQFNGLTFRQDDNQRRQEDIILNTFTSSDTTSMREILRMLRRGSPDANKSQQMNREDLFPVSRSPSFYPRPRVSSSFDRLNAFNFRLKAKKTVAVIRNPKDTCLSCYHQEQKKMNALQGGQRYSSFKAFVEAFLYTNATSHGNYFDYTEHMWSLRDDPNFLVIFFEDLITKPEETIQRINTFMGTNRSLEQIKQIIEITSFGKPQTEVNWTKGERLQQEEMKKTEKVEPSEVEKTSDKSSRRGEIGEWRHVFTVEVNELFDSFLQSWKAGANIPFRFSQEELPALSTVHDVLVNEF